MKEWFEFVGLCLGDGHVEDKGPGRRSLRLYMAQKDEMEIKRKVVVPLGFKFSRVQYDQFNTVYYRFSVKIRDAFKNALFLDLRREDLGCVLRGLFEADGTIDSLGQIRINLTDVSLSTFIYESLKLLGIDCSYRIYNGEGLGKKIKVHRVRVFKCSHGDFRSKVGFITERKCLRLDKSLERIK